MRFRVKLLAAALCSALGAAGAANSQTFSIDAHILATGASVRSSSACARLRATIAEPVAGYSSSVDYKIAAGFRAIAASATPDDIFFSSFEVCP
jgi:hypothetical protein